MRHRRTGRTDAAKRQRRPNARRSAVAAVLGLLMAGGVAGAAPPAPVITAPAGGEHVPDRPTTIAGTVSGDAVLVRVFDGGTPVADTGPSAGHFSVAVGLADGPHTVRARARDAAGAWGPLSDPVSFTVDTVAPAAPAITAPADGQLVGFASITVEGTAEPGAAVRVEASTGAVIQTTADPSGVWAATATFTDAEHTLVATASDAAGNTSLPSAPVTFRVDTIAPAAPAIHTPGHGAFRNETAVSITGTAEPGSTVRVFRGTTIITTTPATDGAWSGAHTFAEGTHTIGARAYDAAGNVSGPSSNVTFTVDLTAPPAPGIDSPRDGDVVPHRYEVTGTAEPFATVELLRTDKVIARGQADGSGHWTIPQQRFSGVQILKARAVDRAGNTGPESPLITFTVDATPPARPVVDTKSGTVFLPTEIPRITGSATDDIGVLAVSLEYYDLTGRAHAIINADCQGCPATPAEWSTTFAPFPGRYVIKVYGVDRAGNRSLPTEVIIWRL